MRLIIAGSRHFELTYSSVDFIVGILKLQDIQVHHIVEVVSGGAKGIDSVGESFAKAGGIPIKQFLPDWDKYGKSAGPIRNEQMAEYADALLLIWDGKSKGSLNMRRNMLVRHKPIYEVVFK